MFNKKEMLFIITGFTIMITALTFNAVNYTIKEKMQTSNSLIEKEVEETFIAQQVQSIQLDNAVRPYDNNFNTLCNYWIAQKKKDSSVILDNENCQKRYEILNRR